MATASQDLNDKLKLEKKLRPALRKYNHKIVKEFKREFAASGNILNVQQFDDELESILTQHYASVSRVFNDRIGLDLPLDVAPTEGERDVIEEALAAWLILHAASQAAIINRTTQIEAGVSVAEALEDDLVLSEIGTAARLTTAAVAGAFLTRKLRGREAATLMSETQTVAEAAKQTETEVLAGLPPSIAGGSPRRTPITKEWETVGDSRVREAHILADGQVRPLNEPFNVGGEALNHPGDISLGASAGNIIKCRCGSTTSTGTIIVLRRTR